MTGIGATPHPDVSRRTTAYFLLTQAGRMRLGNIVDPKYTLGASIRKAYLPSKLTP